MTDPIDDYRNTCINKYKQKGRRYLKTGLVLLGVGLAGLGYGIGRDVAFRNANPVPTSEDYNRVRDINYKLTEPILTENRDLLRPLLIEFSKRDKKFRELIDSANSLVHEKDSLESLASYQTFVEQREDYVENRNLGNSIALGMFGTIFSILGLRKIYKGRKEKQKALYLEETRRRPVEEWLPQ